jgi:hypothetical protein
VHATVLTMPLPTVAPACPPWCSEHTPAHGDEGSVALHERHLGTAAGMRISVWQAGNGP